MLSCAGILISLINCRPHKAADWSSSPVPYILRQINVQPRFSHLSGTHNDQRLSGLFFFPHQKFFYRESEHSITVLFLLQFRFFCRIYSIPHFFRAIQCRFLHFFGSDFKQTLHFFWSKVTLRIFPVPVSKTSCRTGLRVSQIFHPKITHRSSPEQEDSAPSLCL